MPATMDVPPPTVTTRPSTPAIAAPTSPAAPAKPSTPQPPAVAAPAKKASERASDAMSQFAEKPEVLKDRPSKKPEVREATPAGGEKKGGETEQAPPAASDTEKTGEAASINKTPTATDGKAGKVNPWKVVDEWKAKYATLEKQYAETKGKAIDPEKEKQFTERLTKAELREKELVDELRFYNYEKYDEDFKKNYEAPYQAEWRDAVEDVSQLPATLADGTVRAGNASDLNELMAMPIETRRNKAEELFGRFADDVMRLVKDCRKLHDARARALDDAKKGLSEKQKQQMEQTQTQQRTIKEHVGKMWDEANQSVLTHEKYGEYFKPIESDQDGNQKLAKGYELADRAFSENPFDPRLKAEERAAIVKRHSAVRNRAAAFGRLVAWNNQAKAKIAEMEKELAQYKQGEPGAGNGHAAEGEVPMTAQQRADRALGALAH